MTLKATPEQIAKAEAAKRAAEARRSGAAPASDPEPPKPTTPEEELENLHWQLHCERRRADAACRRAALAQKRLYQYQSEHVCAAKATKPITPSVDSDPRDRR